jgi:DNA-3-methyladenine glycosylase I
MIAYHDKEWGAPVYDDKKLFEFLVLESAQAGLSWSTILKRRTGYKKAFANFNPKKISRFGKKEIYKLMTDSGIIRNRLKIEATINNAKRFLEIQKEFESFSNYVWKFVDNKQINGKRKTHKNIPAVTKESELLSKDLKKRGFKFVGPTICYAYMQAVGMVNDHTVKCFRHKEVTQ